MKNLIALLIATLAVSSSATLRAQAPAPKPAEVHNRPEVAVEYTYVHSNAPPGGCGCFSMNGGSIQVAQPFRSGRFSFAFDATFGGSSSVSSNGYDVTLSTFTGGVRYKPLEHRMMHSRWSPFGEVLVGASHAGGSLVSAPNPTSSALVFATNIGGGLDRKINEHWSLRVVEADYFLTTFSNGDNDHQNNIRISTGVVYHFGK